MGSVGSSVLGARRKLGKRQDLCLLQPYNTYQYKPFAHLTIKNELFLKLFNSHSLALRASGTCCVKKLQLTSTFK